MLKTVSNNPSKRIKPIVQVRVLFRDLDEDTLNHLYQKLEPLSDIYEIIITNDALELNQGLVEFGARSVFEYQSYSMIDFINIINPKTGKRFNTALDRLNWLGSQGWSVCSKIPGELSILLQRVKREEKN